MATYYDWNKTFSRQTGTNGEFCLVVGAKNIGKTYGLRLELVRRWFKTGARFVELSRSKEENKLVQQGYLDKLQANGEFSGYAYQAKNNIGYLGKVVADDDGREIVEDWKPFVYFVSLSTFQQEKKRTYSNVLYFIFDEAIIDRKDRYHRYLPNEFSILANLIDSILREQYDNPLGAKVYMMGNSCDLLCPYMQNLGVNSIPEYGYSWHNSKQTLLHYVEPWDVQRRVENTLVGRMLSGSEEARMVFDNEFSCANDDLVEEKTPRAKYHFAVKYNNNTFAVWLDWREGMAYITDSHPKNAKCVYALTKSDSTINYNMVRKTDGQLKMLLELFYANCLRYDSIATQEKFLALLSFFGIY